MTAFLGWLLLAGFLPAACAAQQPADVLVVLSSNRLLPAFVEFDRGLNEGSGTSPKARFLAEFLDAPEFGGRPYEELTATYLKGKYSERPPKAIVAAGAAALDFLLHQRGAMFPGIPIVHAAVDRSFFASRVLPLDVVGIPVDYDIVGTLRLALRLQPHAWRLVVVTGDSPWDHERAADIRAALATLPAAPPVEYLSSLPSAEVASRLAALPRDAIVFTPGYFRDGAGRVFTPRESVTTMAAAAAAPVYVLYASQIGTGAVGGRMTSYVEMGRRTRAIVDRLLEGAAASSIPVLSALPVPAQLDWRQVEKWGIRASLIPEDTVVHFRQPTFWEMHRAEAIAVAAAMLLQAGLIAALLIERRLRRRTATALAESETRISLAADAARLSSFVWRLVQERVRTNGVRSGRASSLRQRAEDFEQVLHAVHPADRERLATAVRKAAAKEAALDVEYRVRLPDGDVRWFVARGRACAGDAQCLTGVKMDITARKTAEFQAQADRAALTHLSRVSTMGQLSAAIAHQLNQPLAAILGNAETARKMLGRAGASPDELREILNDIIDEDHRAAEVIRRLGALYRRGEMERSTFDLNDLVRETLDLLRDELTMRHVTPVVEVATWPLPVEGGRVHLQQVLLNIILNAADAMADVEPNQRVVIVRTSSDRERAQVCIVDCGPGIAAEDLKRVFDPFWSTKSTGGGVGLAICKAIITAHHGTLSAANNPEGGAVFCFTLPLQAPD